MQFERIFTNSNDSVKFQIQWKHADSLITNPDGSIVFQMKDITVPATWSQDAINILAQKYFRKAGVPSATVIKPCNGRKIPRDLMPEWLLPSQPTPDATFGPETSAAQVFHRLAGAWTYHGWDLGLFKLEPQARVFYDEIYFMLANQMAAPNSPQWFNTGLWWAYGIEGPASGQWAINHETGEAYQTSNAYERPQPHACFIQPVADDLVNEGGIMDLWLREVRLFKQGSGTGSNFSTLRGKNEKLSGGGVSSGLMSFLPIGDRSAGSIASGGTTRRAAKMVVVNADHPEIEDFIDWKVREESKAAAMYLGSALLNSLGNGVTDSTARLAWLNDNIPAALQDRLNAGITVPTFGVGWEQEAINSVSGQNANNSVRLTDNFFEAVDKDQDWHLTARTDGKTVKTLKARDLWHKICRAAWACADPGLQFDTTINYWHTCPASGRINASNPCSEYMFLDNTACNLASLNLCSYTTTDGQTFDTKLYRHAIALWTMVLEISIHMASFPSKEIAILSEKFRTLGLGYANLGGLLMRWGIPYDSVAGRKIATELTAYLHGQSILTSALMAQELGPFAGYEENSLSVRNIIQRHAKLLPDSASMELKKLWGEAFVSVEVHGLRNAQLTLQAPTGTIALLMDCDTTGIEPDFALVKYKSLAGGGMMKIVNQAIPVALKSLGWEQSRIDSAIAYIAKNDTIEGFGEAEGFVIREEHLKVFDCAVPSGNGTRAISPMAHIHMMAVIQPFLSGAMSKTVNMPHDATIEDVDEIYRTAHKLGLKAVAIYRDGSKLTQPLNTKKQDKTEIIFDGTLDQALKIVRPSPAIGSVIGDSSGNGHVSNPPPPPTPAFASSTTVPRRSLPMRRSGYRQKFRINDQSVYLATGNYSDGTCGEIFITLAREGSTVRSLMECFAKSVSLGIQYGVPLEEYVDAFIFTHFEPAGMVEAGPESRIKFCTSIVDLIFRELGVTYLNRDDLANIPGITGDAESKTGNPKLDQVLAQAIAAFDALTPEEKEAHRQAQRESWVRGEMELTRWERENGRATVRMQPRPRNDLQVCWQCGNPTLIRTGTCLSCTTCGANSGCA